MGPSTWRASLLTLLAWPLCSVLIGCGESQSSDAPLSRAGAGGENTGSGGSAGTAGTQLSSGGTGLVGGGTAGTANGGTANGGTANGGTANGGAPGSAGTAGGDAGADPAGAGSGGAPIGGAGGSGGSDGGAIPGIDTFTRVTIRSKSANLDPATGTCESAAPGFDDDAVWSSWSFERATQRFTWEYCKGYPGMWDSSSRVLTDVEAQGIVNTLTQIRPSLEGLCIADGGRGELEIQADGTATVYRPDTGWCGSGANDENFVSGLGPLWFWFETLTDPYVFPDLPDTLTLYTGEITDGPFPNPECSKNPFPIEYELDVATATLSWRGMSSDPDNGGIITFCPTEMRVLEPAELDAVLDEYQRLTLGASASCDVLQRPTSLDRPNGQIPWMEIGIDALTDETSSCYGGSSRPYTIGVAALARLVADLTE